MNIVLALDCAMQPEITVNRYARDLITNPQHKRHDRAGVCISVVFGARGTADTVNLTRASAALPPAFAPGR